VDVDIKIRDKSSEAVFIMKKQLHFDGPDCCDLFVDFLYMDIYNNVRAFKGLNKQTIRVWAHNAHRYDIIFILPILQRRFPDRIKIVGSTSSIKYLSILHNFFVFADSCELMQGGLAYLCQNYDTVIKKMKDFEAGTLVFEKY
jgi:hypothetical protein